LGSFDHEHLNAIGVLRPAAERIGQIGTDAAPSCCTTRELYLRPQPWRRLAVTMRASMPSSTSV